MRIGLDISGGDYAPENCLEGAILALSHSERHNAKICLIGSKITADSFLKSKGVNLNHFEFIDAPDVIVMAESPTKAFAQKPNSSIAMGFKALKEGKIDVFISAGNTGAMLVGAMFTVKAIPGVIRPCITTLLPKENGGVGLMLDVGTNADCKPDVLYQFGILGSVCARALYKIENPKVGLLNIGEEPEKGNLVAQAAYNLMKDSKDFNFIGNIEGRDLFNGKADVIVCEGFVGNVVLKAAEAFYTSIRKRNRSDAYFDRFNYELYGGTPILGVNGNVLIGHGISSSLAFQNMVMLAIDLVNSKLNEKVAQVFQ